MAIAADGALSGTPPAGSSGLNSFTVRATDIAGAIGDAILRIQIGNPELPLPWQLEDLGKSGLTNRASYQDGRFTLEGTGQLAGSSDAGCYVWETLGGNGTITVRMIPPADRDRRSRAGVMIRDSLAPNSPQAFVGMDGGGGICWIKRDRVGGSVSMTTKSSRRTPSMIWLRLVRNGRTVSAYTSGNGYMWSKAGAVTMSLGTNIYIGLFAGSGGSVPSTGDFP